MICLMSCDHYVYYRECNFHYVLKCPGVEHLGIGKHDAIMVSTCGSYSRDAVHSNLTKVMRFTLCEVTNLEVVNRYCTVTISNLDRSCSFPSGNYSLGLKSPPWPNAYASDLVINCDALAC